MENSINNKKKLSSKDTDEERVMHSNSDNIKNINEKANEFIDELFESLLSRYQIGLEEWMKNSGFILDNVHL